MNKRERWQKYMEYVAFTGVFLVLCFFLYEYTIYTVNSDASSELVLAKHLADSGGRIIANDWYYSTEVIIFSDQLAYELMFLFTENWSVVRFGGTLIILAVLLLSLYYFCLETVGKRHFPLLAVLVMLPLSSIYFDMVHKFSYYSLFLTTGFIAIGAGMQFAKESSRFKYPMLILGVVISVAGGLMGLRLILTLYIPLALASLMYVWLNKIPKDTKKILSGTAMITGAALIGVIINQTVISKNYSSYNYTTISFKAFSQDGLEKIINSLLELLGYQNGTQVFSKAVLSNAMSGLLLVMSIYCVIQVICNRSKFTAPQQIATYFYLVAVVTLALLYSFTTMQYAEYHSIQAMVHGLPPIFLCFNNKECHGKIGQRIILGICSLALLCGAINYNEMRKVDQTRGQRESAKFLVENGYTQGYASFWNGNVMTELSNGVLEMWVWDEKFADITDPDDIVPWLQSKAHDQPPAAGKVFIFMSANEAYYCEFTKNFSEEDIVFKTENFQEGAIDEYLVYGFDSYEEMRAKFIGQTD